MDSTEAYNKSVTTRNVTSPNTGLLVIFESSLIKMLQSNFSILLKKVCLYSCIFRSVVMKKILEGLPIMKFCQPP